MKIVIAGAGEMGSHLARMLSGNGHDITIIDSDQKLLSDVGESGRRDYRRGRFDDLRRAPQGFGAQVRPFHRREPRGERQRRGGDAGQEARCARKSIARIDNNEYLEPNNKEMFIDMGIDYLFYPEKVAAREVINLLGHTSTTEYVDFSSGKLSLVVFRLRTGLAAGGGRQLDGLRRRPGPAELPHGGHHARRRRRSFRAQGEISSPRAT